jgi:hypothetical protein
MELTEERKRKRLKGEKKKHLFHCKKRHQTKPEKINLVIKLFGPRKEC